MEQEYAAHRRRLAEDWKRLEQQEQETLASLQSKEKDLKKKRELLEWEVDEEMNQVIQRKSLNLSFEILVSIKICLNSLCIILFCFLIKYFLFYFCM